MGTNKRPKQQLDEIKSELAEPKAIIAEMKRNLAHLERQQSKNQMITNANT